MSILRAPALVLVLLLTPGVALAGDETRPGLLLESRLRSETVVQDGLAANAHALTLRTRLGWRSPTMADFQFLVEGEGVSVLDDRYSAPLDPVAGRPAVADGAVWELNRAQVRWTGVPHSEVVIGRQRLALGNSRFVGNVGWRQNEQTFDAVKLVTTALKPVTLTYAWSNRVQRPLGDKHPQGVWRGDIQMVQAEMTTPIGDLTGYGLVTDFDNAAAQSSSTWGVRLAGSRPLTPGIAMTYAAEYARQRNNGANPARFDLDYQVASVGLQHARWSATLVRERLDGDGTVGFQTPLGSGHGFQGWSDVIAATPVFGVRDLYLRGQTSVDVKALHRPLRLTVEAHDFRDAAAKFRLGSELDVSAAVAINPHWSLELKAARFEGERTGFPDTSKAWAILDYHY